MVQYTEREQVVEIVNRLFYHTDNRSWEALINEVFSDQVFLDMTSMGAPSSGTLKSQEICEQWKNGFEGIDAIHHQPGNYIIEFKEDSASVLAHAIASHYKESATLGTTREFIGSYDFGLIKTDSGWRLNRFTFNLKYAKGNLSLE